MINKQLLEPRNIVVVGGSDDITKPGGKMVKNLIDHKSCQSDYCLNEFPSNLFKYFKNSFFIYSDKILIKISMNFL